MVKRLKRWWKRTFSPRSSLWRRTPRSAIASATVGDRVVVAGRLRLGEGEPLVAPLSHRPCAYFEVTIEELDVAPKSGYATGGWTMLLFDWAAQDCWLEDDSGRALLALSSPPVTAQLTSAPQDLQGSPRSLPPEAQAYLARVNHRLVRPHRGGTLRIREGALVEDQTMIACGRCERRSDGRGGDGLRMAASYIVIASTTEQPLTFSDDPALRP